MPDQYIELRRLLRQVTDDEITSLRVENEALRAALLKAEAALASRESA